jgi:hypothetical protein
VRLLTTPALRDVPVTVVSTNSAVASVSGPVVVRAGEATVELNVRTGVAGAATLFLEAGGQRYALDVSVDGTRAPESAPLIAASPAGVSVIGGGGVGRVIAPAGPASAPTIVVKLLAAPSTAPTVVTVKSLDPAVASVGTSGPTTIVIPAGQQAIDVPLSIPGREGATIVTFEFGGQKRELLVVVGTPPASETPTILAPPVGVDIKK